VIDRPAFERDTLVRAGLVLTATGIVSAAAVRHALDDSSDLPFAYGFLFFLGLILLASPRRQLSAAPLIAFGAFAATYLGATFSAGGNDPGVVLYVATAALAYLVTPRPFRTLAVAAFALWTPALRLFGPDPTAGLFPPFLAIAAVLALAFLVAVLVSRDAADQNEQLRRVGLGVLAVACVASVVERHLVVASLRLAPDDVMAMVVVIALPVIAVARLRPRTRDALAIGLALAILALVGIADIAGKGYHVDSVTVPHRAAELLLNGQDPYRDLDVAEALAHFGVPESLATHLENGSQLHSLNYPALSFLSVAPFVALGLGDIRVIYLAELIVLVLICVRRVRMPWRPFIAAAVVGNTIIIRQNILAGVDPLWALLLSVGILFIDHPILSAVAVGLAAADRQPAWFFVPFYLLIVWRRDGGRQTLRRGAIVAAAFAIPNLPFLVADPGPYWSGVTAPILGALESYGVGFVRFGMDGVLPLWPRGVYGVLSVVAFVALLWLLARRWRELPNAALVFPSVALWFAWRSLQNYFAFVGIFALLGDEAVVAGAELADPEPSHQIAVSATASGASRLGKT
jgi:hypothetical protein